MVQRSSNFIYNWNIVIVAITVSVAVTSQLSGDGNDVVFVLQSVALLHLIQNHQRELLS